MKLTSVSNEGKQLNLCRGNTTFCHVDFFCLQEKGKMKREVFSDSYTEATASAKMNELFFTRWISFTGLLANFPLFHAAGKSSIINTYSTKAYVLLHFKHKNDVTVIIKLLYRATSRRRVAL